MRVGAPEHATPANEGLLGHRIDVVIRETYRDSGRSSRSDHVMSRSPRPNLRLPVIVAPMFLVSGVELLVASCMAGIVGTMPSLNGRSANDFAKMLEIVESRLSEHRRARPEASIGPYAINMTLRLLGSDRFKADMATVRRHKVPIVITSVGDPARVVEDVHGYGGLVFHDVINVKHARKAADAGVDGLVLVCAGAGGQAGVLNPFAFLPQVREFFDGLIVLAGAISDGRAIRAAQALGADLVYMGTRFIATRESLAVETYKEMLVSEEAQEVAYTPAFSGVAANYLKASIRRAGLDPDNLPAPKGLWQPDLPPGVKAWRDIWSAGHGVGCIHDVLPVANLVSRLEAEYRAAAPQG